MSVKFATGLSEVRLSDEATEGRFKREDLSHLAVLHLATHGLTAAESKIFGVDEPALVFTPPGQGSEVDDGLLTSSEVAGLSMDADWVVLSACNTASGDGTGDTGLSGLARSFFYAGARSLLVSHWPVRDDVAATMTVRVVELEKSNPQWSRAEALAHAIQEVRKNSGKLGVPAIWAHPTAWAPFSLVGDVGL